MKPAHAPTILLTGFEPFDGEALNPSWLAVQRLGGEEIVGHRVHAACLPVAFVEAPRHLRRAIVRHRPDLVLCVGQAGGRAQMSLERVAINLIDARIADNTGKQPVDRPVITGGPAAYFATLPIKAMRSAAQGAGVPTEISHSAGTFVCNQVFYALMHELAQGTSPDRRGGFVHIPYLPEQASMHPGAPSLALETVVAGLRAMIDAALRRRRDLRISAGRTH